MYIVYGPPTLGRYHTTDRLSDAIGALQVLIQSLGVDGRIESSEAGDILYQGSAESGLITYIEAEPTSETQASRSEEVSAAYRLTEDA